MYQMGISTLYFFLIECACLYFPVHGTSVTTSTLRRVISWSQIQPLDELYLFIVWKSIPIKCKVTILKIHENLVPV